MHHLKLIIAIVVAATLVYLFTIWATSPDMKVGERAAPPPPVVTVVPTPGEKPVSNWRDVQEVPGLRERTHSPSELEGVTPEAFEDPTVVARVGQSDKPGQLIQPDLGLNIAVLELPEDARDPITPPTYQEAYWSPTPVKPIDPEVPHIPASDAPDLAVIAAHTSFLSDTDGFNLLYDWREARFTLEIGDEVWLKAESPGDDWLVYKLVNQVFVPKGELADNSEVWGTAPKPNHLLLIGCRQIAPGESSQDNFVLDFVFDRVDHL